MSGSSKQPGVDIEKKEISFELLKSNLFRVIHCDGIFGGVNPKGNQIRMTFFGERWPIPKKMVHRISDAGNLEEEIKERREVKNSVVRELEAEIVMDLETAISVHEWLGNQLTAVKSFTDSVEEKDD